MNMDNKPVEVLLVQVLVPHCITTYWPDDPTIRIN